MANRGGVKKEFGKKRIEDLHMIFLVSVWPYTRRAAEAHALHWLYGILEPEFSPHFPVRLVLYFFFYLYENMTDRCPVDAYMNKIASP